MSTLYRYGSAVGRQWPRRCLVPSLSTLNHHGIQHSMVPIRGAKTKSSLKSTELPLPQGVIPLDPLPMEEPAPAYPTVVLQARNNMIKFEKCVLLTRVGGFYELYFEHAKEFGPLLNLKVAQKKTNAGTVAMAGFPFFQLDRFLKILVQDLNQYVAIAEEFPNDASGKVKAGGLMHDRRVARVITPGTLIDENFMDPYSNNYIMAIHVNSPAEDLQIQVDPEEDGQPIAELPPVSLGFAWLDLSTGAFFTQNAALPSLTSILSRIAPREVVLDTSLELREDLGIPQILKKERYLTTFSPSPSQEGMGGWASMLDSDMSTSQGQSFSQEEISAGNLLLHYVDTRLQGKDMKLQPPQQYHALETMVIDKTSMKALEIKETIREGTTKGSLFHTIRRTVTSGGTRLLSDMLTSPSTSLEVINSRLDAVTCMLENTALRERILALLKESHDSRRLVQKFILGRGDADDMIALANTIDATEEIVTTLRDPSLITGSSDTSCLEDLAKRINLDGVIALSRRIKSAIDEDGIIQQQNLEDAENTGMIALAEDVATTQGQEEDVAAVKRGSAARKKQTSLRDMYSDDAEAWIMKAEASPRLKSLHKQLEQLSSEKAALGERLKEHLGASTLTLRWTPALGHICHIKGKDMRNLTDIKSVSSSKSTRSFHHPEWTSLGQSIILTKTQIRSEETRVFHSLRESVISSLVPLRRNASILDALDVACSFAILASEHNLVRPIITTKEEHKIIGGCHPTVAQSLLESGRHFIRNDLFLSSSAERLWLITGPNMAGKSTFLRQNALITIMAQVGSYVPAEFAEIGIVDAIFSRVGSADNLAADQSTFMVEMLETAQILKNGTARSFVIMDEIGRGTTPEDGIAVAYACLHHLYHVNRSRTLFATHFHGLAGLVSGMEGVGFYCTDVKEEEGKDGGKGGGFSFVHKLRKGVNYRSHALKVARLAGLPEKALEVAGELLRNRGKPPGP